MNRAQSQASKLLQLLKIYEPPVDVFSIAAQLDIPVVFRDFDDDVSGMLVIRDGQATIGVNEQNHTNRQRFTVAHEIGHFILHKPRSGVFVDSTYTYRRDRQSSEGSILEETQANAFAAELLMPRDMVERYLDKNEVDLIDSAAVSDAAVEFQVSVEAFSIRLVTLGLVTM